jgi:hypothetical protein
MDAGQDQKPAETHEFVGQYLVDQPESHTSLYKQRPALANPFRAPFDGQSLSIQKISANVIILDETVEGVQVLQLEFGVSQSFGLHLNQHVSI